MPDATILIFAIGLVITTAYALYWAFELDKPWQLDLPEDYEITAKLRDHFRRYP